MRGPRLISILAFSLAALVVHLLLSPHHLIHINLKSSLTQKTDFSSSKDIDGLLSLAGSGTTFTGKKVRTFSHKKRIFHNHVLPPPPSLPAHLTPSSVCHKWAVVTTVFEPSEAVRRFLFRSDWCLVVVGDKGGPPSPYVFPTFGDYHNSSNIVFLSAEDQRRMRSEFVDLLPWNSFGRKNVGYLYAVARGAEVIWDFDDDNMLKFWIEGASPDPFLDLDSVVAAVRNADVIDIAMPDSLKQNSTSVFNPYPLLGCPFSKCWPRGFPLTQIVSDDAQNTSLLTVKNFPTSKIAVLQSLADHNPDVDSIFRMTQGTQFYFTRPSSKGEEPLPIVLPSHLMSPINDQATLHFKSSFFALYRPVTAGGGVSDIWRSYIAQAVFRLLGLQVGFLPRPLVIHERRPHSLEADFDAEIPLFKQTHALLECMELWLEETESTDDLSTEEVVEDLYINLYERKFLEIEDVVIVQVWLQALNSVGYKMPSLSKDVASKKKHLEVRRGADLYLNVEGLVEAYSSGMPPNCQQLSVKKTFWTSDLHDGTRMDLSTQLTTLGQKFILGGIKREGVPHALKMPGISFYKGPLSPELQYYQSHSSWITPDDIVKNHEFFKDVSEIQNTDAFVCSFPASMCQLWVPFNKSIIYLPSHRYNLGRCTPEGFLPLNSQMEEMARSDRHVVAAMSRYDLEYMNYYLDIPEAKIMSSLAGLYSSGSTYNATRSEILLVEHRSKNLMSDLKFESLLREVNVAPLRSVYGGYQFSDLQRHPAIVYIPYSVMSFKLTEFYSLAIPLFMPSVKYFRSFGGLGPDRLASSHLYCGESSRLNDNLKKRPNSSHPYSPNVDFSEDPEAEMYWLQFSDFFDWPFIEYFDDISDLVEKIKGANLTRMHLGMKRSYEARQYLTFERWCDVIPHLG